MLDLRDHDKQATSQGRGCIRIHISIPDASAAAASALADAHSATNRMGTGIVATGIQHVGDVTAAVSAQSTALTSLNSVLSKLDIFVKIVDKTANVCAQPPYYPTAKRAIGSSIC